jgi:two-component system, response regulator
MMHSGYVLVADDSATDFELTHRALELGGVSRIVWVQDGEAALDYMFRTGPYEQRAPGLPHLLLLDLHMPRIDGLDVLARIKADPRTRPTPVVIMSSSDQESDMARSYENQANSYIVKPTDFKQFTAQVSLLGRYWMSVNRAME